MNNSIPFTEKPISEATHTIYTQDKNLAIPEVIIGFRYGVKISGEWFMASINSWVKVPDTQEVVRNIPIWSNK